MQSPCREQSRGQAKEPQSGPPYPWSHTHAPSAPQSPARMQGPRAAHGRQDSPRNTPRQSSPRRPAGAPPAQHAPLPLQSTHARKVAACAPARHKAGSGEQGSQSSACAAGHASPLAPTPLPEPRPACRGARTRLEARIGSICLGGVTQVRAMRRQCEGAQRLGSAAAKTRKRTWQPSRKGHKPRAACCLGRSTLAGGRERPAGQREERGEQQVPRGEQRASHGSS